MAILLEEQATLTSQNQITIPKRVRDVLKLRGGGSRVGFIVEKNGIVRVVRAASSQAKADPDLQPFLALLGKDLRENPQRIKPLQPSLLKRARDLVKGVEVNPHGPLIGQD